MIYFSMAACYSSFTMNRLPIKGMKELIKVLIVDDEPSILMSFGQK